MGAIRYSYPIRLVPTYILKMSKQQVVDEIHKAARKNFIRRKFVQKEINDTWQTDLVEMISFWKENKGFRYLLTVIDTFSKYAYAETVKTKSALDVEEPMKSVLKRKVHPRIFSQIKGKMFLIALLGN